MSTADCIILGDFNLPSIKWGNENPVGEYVSPVDRVFYDTFVYAGLQQVVEEPTNFPSSTILDLCLVTHSERLGSVLVHPPLPPCSHGIVQVPYIFQSYQEQKEERQQTKKLWTKGKYRLISGHLAEFEWDL